MDKIKVCFVGIHNKPGKEPLDSSTKTGQVVDRIIIECGEGFEFEKRNLFNATFMPPKWCRERLTDQFKMDAKTWYVGLGNVVKECLYDRAFNFLPVYHPGYIMRMGGVDNYVENVAEMIKQVTAQEKMKRVQLTEHASARVSEDCSAEVIDVLTKIAKLARDGI